MSDLMEQNLGDVVLGRLQGEVAGDRNTLVSMVALTQARGGSVKAKRPRASNPMEGEKPRRFLLLPRRFLLQPGRFLFRVLLGP